MRTLALLFLLTSSPLIWAQQRTLKISGLQEPVEIIRDQYGVNHIYARNENDLFFAQGYCAARDRIFQFEIWRRQSTGTMAEILGTKEVQRDIGARLFKFRGDLEKEFNHYHPHGAAIIRSFTAGINAFIAETEKNPALLPLEFRLLGIKPGRWTPEVVISRHQGLLMNLAEEVATGKAVALAGTEIVKSLNEFEPANPDISLDPAIPTEQLLEDVIAPYSAFRRPMNFQPGDLTTAANPNLKEYESMAQADATDYENIMTRERFTIGSNNWIVSGSRSASGFPLLANDPHRAIAAPSLRYLVHLNAPGWNVVGGGEPTIPGVSIGHNDYGAWGLTIFAIDIEDLYYYELNPANPLQYKYKGGWETMRVIQDTVRVKGSTDVLVEHLYTRHGPVTRRDLKKNAAWAVRAAWQEPGGAPYLASLRMNQSTSWEEFREACSYSRLPGENMIWADRKGTIGWQAVGIAPIRKNWSGLVPVPGDGRYEWEGYLPIPELPNVLNPEKGFWATANENNVPENYPHHNAVGYEWADRYRADRINEVLAANNKVTLQDMMKLQFDYYSLPSRALIPLLQDITFDKPQAELARKRLLQWDHIVDKNSVDAAIYVAWERKLIEQIGQQKIPESLRPYITSVPLRNVVRWVTQDQSPETRKLVRETFLAAIDGLRTRFGPDMIRWIYGQAGFHHSLIKHPLSNAVNEATRKKLEAGPMPRSGYGATPGMTTNNDNQTAGASFRIVVDTKDWDTAMFTNTPGQSGNPDSRFYKNLFPLWANDVHFPVYFSRSKIEKAAAERLQLVPQQ